MTIKRTLAFTIFLLLHASASAQIGRGVITGRMRTPSGAPAAGLRVAAVEAPDANRPVAATSLMASIAQTDSEGRFRLEDIPPGRYYVVAGRIDTPTYFPGARDAASARAITVTAGSTVSGIDFSAVAPLKVTGRVVGLDAAGAATNAFAEVRLVPARNVSDAFILVGAAGLFGAGGTGISGISPDGSFEFNDVPPGAYSFAFQGVGVIAGSRVSICDDCLSFRIISGAAENEGQVIVVADLDVRDVVVSFARPVPGRIVVDQDGPVLPFSLSFSDSSNLKLPAIVVRAVSSSSPSFSVGLPIGTYRVEAVGLPAGYSVKSIMFGSADVMRSPLTIGSDVREIVVSLAVSNPPPWVRVSGRVTGPGRPAEGTLLEFRNSSLPRGATAALQRDGAFQFDRILPGRYAVVFAPSPEGVNEIEIDIPRKDVSNVDIPLPGRVRVSGRVTVEQGAVLPPLHILLNSLVDPASRVQAILDAPPARVSSVNRGLSVAQDGTFSAILPEGEYRASVGDVQIPYAVQSFTNGAANLLTGPLKVTGRDAENLSLALSIPVFVVKGHVYSASGIEGVRVTLSGAGIEGVRFTQPRADGGFELPPVPSGSYKLQVEPGGTPVPVVVNRADVEGKDFTIVRGRVIVTAGAPTPMLRFWFSSATPPLIAVTDVRPDGTFLVPLSLGDYRVQPAVPPGYTLKSFGVGSEDLGEGTLTVSSRGIEELRAVLDVISPVRIAGRVVGMGNASRPLTVQLVRTSSLERLEAPVATDGSFEFLNAPRGYYQISVPVELAVANSALIEANADVTGVSLSIPRQIPISGRVVLENGASLPDVSAMAVMAIGPDMATAGSVRADGTFSFTSVEGEQRISARSIPAGYDVKSITSGGADLLRDPLNLTGPPVEIQVVLTKR